MSYINSQMFGFGNINKLSLLLIYNKKFLKNSFIGSFGPPIKLNLIILNQENQDVSKFPHASVVTI